MTISRTPIYATYSIVAQDEETGHLGVAVQTHQMCVGAVVPWLLPGVGAIATQSLANVSFGPIGLQMLAEGVSAEEAIQGLVASDKQASYRQIGIVDGHGRAAAWTGENCIPEAGHLIGERFCVQANMMELDTVIPAMAAAYQETSGEFAIRLLASLSAAQDNQGDIRGMQSASLTIVEGRFEQAALLPAWRRIYDLRVDEHADPLSELARLTRLRQAQLVDNQGEKALEDGDLESALRYWAQARKLAPELEELSFWQAVTLADDSANLTDSVPILSEMLESDPRSDLWIELLRRIQACGFIKRPGTAEELISALGPLPGGDFSS